MRNALIVFLIISTAFILAACDSGAGKADNKYMMNAVYSYGGDLEETVISYEVIISGDIEDIKNIDAYEVLINVEHLDLLIENGHHSSQKVIEKDSYFKIEGKLTFNTSGKSKEEISEMDLLQGVKIIDVYGDEEVLEFMNLKSGKNKKNWYDPQKVYKLGTAIYT